MVKRVFISIGLPQETKKEVGKIISELKKINPDYGIRWVGEENLHLTLHFFGDLDEKQIIQVEAGIDEIVKKTSSFKVSIGNLGCFPDEKNPKIIYLEITDTDAIRVLIGKLEIMLENFGFPVDARPWKPHLTIGRIKENIKLKIMKSDLVSKTFEVKSVELIESHLTPEGPIYTVIKSFPLK